MELKPGLCNNLEGWEGVGGRFKRQGTRVYLWLIYADVAEAMAFLPGSKHLLVSCLRSPSAVILEPPKIKSGEGDGTQLQYSCLENPMEGGAW